MSEALDKAIEELLEKLNQQSLEVAETKKAINQLCKLSGKEPHFGDVEPESVAGSNRITANTFFQKPLATAVREFLEMRNQLPATTDEIIQGLKSGGFEFPWKEEMVLKNLRITLSSGYNRGIFVFYPNETYGLWKWHGGKPKEKEKNGGKQGQNANEEAPEGKNDSDT